MAVRREHPPQVGTIGSTIAAGLKMWISCDAVGCRNNADVDLFALRDQLGADYRIRRLRRADRQADLGLFALRAIA